jgi:hypothetical protein
MTIPKPSPDTDEPRTFGLWQRGLNTTSGGDEIDAQKKWNAIVQSISELVRPVSFR